MTNLGYLVQRFHDGERLDDEELISLRDAYKNAATACSALGDEYLLPFRDANLNYMRVRDICDARGID